MRQRCSPFLHAITALCGLALLAGCSREPTESAASAPEASTAATEVSRPSTADAYHGELVERFGEDYAACGESRRTLPGTCDEVGDPAAQAGATHVLLMLDASGSMAGLVGGERKLAVAQDALTQFVERLPDTAQVGLRVYGHTGDNTAAGKAASCAGSALLYPFAPLDRARFARAVRSFEPTGWTPIAASLEAARRDLDGAGATRGVVYLVSDGIETCDADPVAAARVLRESGIDVVVNVIGFDVGAADARQLRAVAAAGGGQYLSAAGRDDLHRIFNERIGEAFARFNCVAGEHYAAFNETSAAQYGRFNCLATRAAREFNNVAGAIARDANAGRIDSDTRRQVLERARDKRDGIIEPARQERDAVMREARSLRDGETSRERQARDRRVDEARRDRDAARR